MFSKKQQRVDKSQKKASSSSGNSPTSSKKTKDTSPSTMEDPQIDNDFLTGAEASLIPTEREFNVSEIESQLAESMNPQENFLEETVEVAQLESDSSDQRMIDQLILSQAVNNMNQELHTIQEAISAKKDQEYTPQGDKGLPWKTLTPAPTELHPGLSGTTMTKMIDVINDLEKEVKALRKELDSVKINMENEIVELKKEKVSQKTLTTVIQNVTTRIMDVVKVHSARESDNLIEKFKSPMDEAELEILIEKAESLPASQDKKSKNPFSKLRRC